MSAEIKILVYAVFAAILFVFPSLPFYLICGLVLSAVLVRIPWRAVRAGWLPIGMFLAFTFVSNAVNSHGMILFSAGPLVVTDEGLTLATVRSARLLLMIMGVKAMMGTTKTDEVIGALGRLLAPLERAGVPVSDFIHTMGLTVQCFPALKDMAAESYQRGMRESRAGGVLDKARVMAGILRPLFVESLRRPESFFVKGKGSEEHV